ncbi:MAG: acetylornithine/succinylornithine family transaminase [Caldilineaceae bacterium]|nr:acetylornithine/succinylornithine family transaminase [Caldilineaceae bacterium]MBP8107495.1 acetylornithine/succinylornithine family transaminase [Caldilineaceae bacterium]MBP8123008.1 acetylornithine/succinylornithine family transaminase [Caldilineaceae bacterium]MBP9073686.1 acetylornithine/succinylornithine family transaminase [Caldilineaceae bacterium]
MNSQEIIDLEQEFVLGVYGRAPFVLERGEGSTVYDTEGRAYLDCVAGIAVNVFGYGDAGVTQSIAEAASTGLLHVSNLYHTAPHARLAQILCENSFADKVHFSLTGADANEGAFKFARRYAREHGHADKFEILAFTNAFHGRLFGSLAATPRPKYQEAFLPLMPGVRFAEFNNLASVRQQMNDKVCAIIVEPIQGEGGIFPADAGFLRGLRQIADEFDALLIYDEVQCGLGRTGHLWGHQSISADADSFAPDMLTLAKPLAAGLPMGAILMRQKVADAIHKGDHASTFAGNPFTAHVAHHVVGRVADPVLLANVRAKGDYLMELLEELNSPHILAVRGKGLLVGVELDMEAAPLIAEAYKRGLILVNAGSNVLRFVPPLIITRSEIEQAVTIVGEILQTAH